MGILPMVVGPSVGKPGRSLPEATLQRGLFAVSLLPSSSLPSKETLVHVTKQETDSFSSLWVQLA